MSVFRARRTVLKCITGVPVLLASPLLLGAALADDDEVKGAGMGDKETRERMKDEKKRELKRRKDEEERLREEAIAGARAACAKRPRPNASAARDESAEAAREQRKKQKKEQRKISKKAHEKAKGKGKSKGKKGKSGDDEN